MALTDNLISYWMLDEASGNRADAHGSNTLTDNNTVASGTGKINLGADFENTDQDYLSHASNSDLRLGDIDFTFQAWVKLESKGSGSDVRMILVKAGSTNGEYGLWYDTATDRFTFNVWGNSAYGNAGSIVASTFGSPSTGVWYLIHAGYDATFDLLFICVNAGTVDTQAHTGGTFLGTDVFSLSTPTVQAMDGLMDEVGLWKRVLTTPERTSLYNGGSGFAYPFTADPLTAGVISEEALGATTATIGSTNWTGGTGTADIQWLTSTDGSSYSPAGSPQTGSTGAVTDKSLSTLTNGQPLWVKYELDDGVDTVESNVLVIVPHTVGQLYVDHAATNGVGSLGNPWSPAQATHYALGNVLDGDRLSVNRGGSYDVNWVFREGPGGITAAGRFAINRYGSGSLPVIDADNGDGIDIGGMPYTTVEWMDIRGSGLASNGTTTSTGSGIKATLTGASDVNGLRLLNNAISGFGIDGIHVEVAAAATNYFNGVLVQGNTIDECGYYGISLQHGAYADFHQTYRFRSPYVGLNNITNCYGNTAAGNTGYGINVVNAITPLTERNRVFNCGGASSTGGGGPVGIIYAEVDGGIIQFNEVDSQHTGQGSDGEGIDLDGGCINCIVQYNRIRNCDGPAFYDFWFVGATPNNNNTFRFNSSRACGRRSLLAADANFCTWLGIGSGCTNTHAYNNTDYSPAGGANAETQSIYDLSSSSFIRNNILGINGSGRTFGTFAEPTATIQGNRWYPFGSATFSITIDGNTYTSLTDLRTAGYEKVTGAAVGSTGDPALVDIADDDSDFTLGDFDLFTGHNPTNATSAAGGLDMAGVFGIDPGPYDFHGNPLRDPDDGTFPVGAVRAAAAVAAGGAIIGSSSALITVG